MSDATITDEDREAAAFFWIHYCKNDLAWRSLSQAAQQETIKAFAAHRELAVQALNTSANEALRAENARLREVIRTYSRVHGVLTEDDRKKLRAALGEQP